MFIFCRMPALPLYSCVERKTEAEKRVDERASKRVSAKMQLKQREGLPGTRERGVSFQRKSGTREKTRSSSKPAFQYTSLTSSAMCANLDRTKNLSLGLCSCDMPGYGDAVVVVGELRGLYVAARSTDNRTRGDGGGYASRVTHRGRRLTSGKQPPCGEMPPPLPLLGVVSCL